MGMDKTAIALVAATCLMLFVVDFWFTPIDTTVFKATMSRWNTNSTNKTKVVKEAGDGRNRTDILFDTCILKELDPWDSTIAQYVNNSFNPLENCKPAIKEATKLQDGKLFVLDDRADIACYWRCLIPKDDYSYRTTFWKKLITNESTPKCDIMETECREEVLKDETQPIDSEVKEKTYYEFLHAQIYRNTTSELVEEPKELEKPDVHLIIFDAVSESQFIRSMPKTRHYLREYYEAVSFRHLNKVGDNSRPNGFALLLGKAVDPIKKSPMSVGYKSDFVDTGCDTPLDHDQFVGFQFQEAGYKTLMSEDWALGVFNWPYCIGFQEKPPVDHYMRPFQLRVEGKYRTKFLQNNTYQGVCRPPFTPQMEYLQDFLDKYPDKPKFTLTWMTYATHDSVNGLFPADDYFYDFFKKNNAKLNNSYVFVMADHGFRYYPEANTTLGKKEDRNPLLFMSLPASLRRDKDLMATVRNNAHQLISHYDLYATLADIVAPHRPQNSSKILLHGSSVLKPLPQPRTCDRLRIPFEYCLCENENVELPDDAAPSREAAALMVQKMNSVIKKDKHLKGRCATLTLSHAPVALKQFEFGGNFTIYQVTFQVLPGNGEFSGYIEQNANSTDWKLFNDHLSRLDIYGETARCAKKSTFAPYCYCKSLFKKNQ